MTYPYPRNRRRIFALGGIFDDFADTTKSPTKWFETWSGSNVAKSFVSAPGGAGGNALRLLGTVGNGIGLAACGTVSPFPNKSNLYYISPINPYQWKMKAEFRMYIHEDEPDATNVLSHSAGFCLDGAVNWYSTFNQKRTYVLFNVSNGKVGIATGHGSSGLQCNIVYSEDWSGSYDTWYDVRIEWEHDFHRDTDWQGIAGVVNLHVDVTVYVNNVQLFSQEVTLAKWRENTANMAYGVPFGRCGPTVVVENDGGATNGNYVDVYFKDVWITRDSKLLEFESIDSILSKTKETRLMGQLVDSYPHAVTKGLDVQLYCRNSLSDNFTAQFRGLIREASVLEGKKLVLFEAEGYESVLVGEKAENKSYTTQTAASIIQDIIDSPEDKYLFNTTTYFDAVSATYSRVYLNLDKIDILMEMASLESFILFLDEANNWHFQNYYTNETDIDLLYTRDKIYGYNADQTFIRQPNFLRVLGSGVQATRQISEESFSNLSVVYRNINRLDLTTQQQVDDALDYYISAFLEPIRIIELKLRANYKVQKGTTIRITVPPIDIDNVEFLVVSVKSDHRSDMELTLLEVKPHLSILISELYERADLQESQAFPSDDLTGEEVVKIEGVCDCLISFFFQIHDNYATANCVMSGQGVVTEKGMEFFTNFWEETAPNTITTSNYLAVGNGTTPPKPSDNALASESYRGLSTRIQDIYKNAGTSLVLGVRYEIQQWGSSQQVNLSELGLFDAASSGNCFARAVFPTVTVDRSIAEVWCWFKITPKAGPLFMNHGYPIQVSGYLYNQSFPYNQFTKMTKGGIFGTKSFTVPHVLSEEESETGGVIIVCPQNAAQMDSWSMTKILSRYMYKMEWTYTFDYAERYNSSDGDAPVAWLGVTNADSSKYAWIQVWFRTDKLLSDYAGYFFHVIIWLRFLRGDVDPYRQYGTELTGCPKN